MVVNALWGIFQSSWWSDMAESMKGAWKGQGGMHAAATIIPLLVEDETGTDPEES